ncbi:MAG: MBOAT family protein [Anaerolineae bacterium]|nr:MBOAT family protein [Anaerolineae bacterium]MCW5898022.1 MBOAT family protein [Flavobacteriales bacterium]
MLFNSIDFLVFLPLVFLLYWAVGAHTTRRNAVVLAASYVFYGWWDWRFLGLIALSTAVDYAVGRGLATEEDPRRRKLLLWTSLAVNLGLLGFFKYANFFIESFTDAFTFMGTPIAADRLDIVLPVGISFYTFQTLSYTLDVYHRRLAPSRDALAFSAYVAFFPQLVAGPIERATSLLPQFAAPRVFDRSSAVDGLRQILWGFFKKVVIADNCALLVDGVFGAHVQMAGSTLLLASVLFAFQIYGDFSGYSDIAIGTARLFGFGLMRNFAFPYFSRDIAEFWRRWHISLSTWFRDYLYVPLGGSRGGTAMRVRNTFIIFLVSGFWHGANWTFVVWGALNALYFLPLLLAGRNRTHLGTVAEGRLLPTLADALRMLLTFLLTCLAWVFFRAEDLTQAWEILARIGSPTLFATPKLAARTLVVPMVFFLLMEWLGRSDQHVLERIGLRWPTILRWGMYAMVLTLIGLYMSTEETPFIYFQF